MLKKHLLSILVAGVCAAAGAAVFAEENPSATAPRPEGASASPVSQTLPDTVVSADKEGPFHEPTELGTLTRSAPISGTVVPREEIEDVRFVDQRRELLNRVPGMTLIRNIRIPDGGKSYTDKRVDGMRVNGAGNFNVLDETNPGDIERVEIITGPGSVLNSSNAYGGTINVITREPPRIPEYRVQLEGGQYGFRRVDASTGGTTEGGTGYFADVNVLDNDGWRERSMEKKTSVSAKAVFGKDESSKLTLRVEGIDGESEAPGSLTQAQFDDNWQQAQPGTYSRTEVKYTTPSVRYVAAFGGGGRLDLAAMRRSTDQSSFSTGISDTDTTETGVQVKWRQDFTAGKGTLYVGMDHMQTRTDSRSYSNLGVLGESYVRGNLTTTSFSREDHASPFVHYEFSPISSLRLSAGVRFDNVEYEIDDRTSANKDGAKRYREPTFKTGATFEFAPGQMLWGSVAEGFLAPAVSTLLGTGGTPNTTTYVPPNMDLGPEESLTTEIGLRGLLLSKALRYDIVAYNTDIRDQIVREGCLPTEVCYQKNVTAGEVNLRGLETTLVWDMSRLVELTLAHSYSDVRYEQYVAPTYDYSGNRYKGSPLQHLNVRVALKPAPSWRVELEGDHISDYYTNSENNDGYSRPNVFNLRARFDDGRWSYWANVLNVLDTKYAERANWSSGQRRYDEGYRPRWFRGGVSYRW